MRSRENIIGSRPSEARSAVISTGRRRLKLKEEPQADVARYDLLLKKLAIAAIAVMPMLVAAMSNRVEAPYGTP